MQNEIIVNMNNVKAALFDKFREDLLTTEIKERDNVIIDVLTAGEVIDIVEECGCAYEE